MILFAALMLISLIWVAVQLAVGSFFGMRATSVQLGMGPQLRSFYWGETRVGVGPIPGASVQFTPEFDAISYGRFSAVMLLPWILLGALAATAGARLEDFASGATLLIRFRDVLTHWGAWDEALRATPMVSLAQLGARWVAINLIPLGTFASGQLISRLLPVRLRGKFNSWSFFVLLALVALGLVRSLI